LERITKQKAVQVLKIMAFITRQFSGLSCLRKQASSKIAVRRDMSSSVRWIPAFAGMTKNYYSYYSVRSQDNGFFPVLRTTSGSAATQPLPGRWFPDCRASFGGSQ